VVGDVTISGGLFYLGAPPTSSAMFDVERLFVDPSLNIAKNRSAKTDPPTYYPSYSKITPSQRRGFLTWMANGRSDPDENLSLVFLFFYGLECRLFKEGATRDAPLLIAEVERLLAIYGKSGSFHHYASHFLACARACAGGGIKQEIDLHRIPQEMQLDARAYLGSKLAEGATLGADDALIWAVSSPVSWRKRWPNDQKDVFEHLWRNRFTTRFPGGLRIKAPKDKIKAIYRPASRSFEAPIKGLFETLPDPAAETVLPLSLKVLVEECWVDGGSFANSSTRRKEAESPLSAALLLPADVWVQRNQRLLTTLTGHLANARTDTLVLPIVDVFKMSEASVSIAPKTLLAFLKRLSEGLWTVGVGIEPDGNYADAEVSFAGHVCLFKIPASVRGAGYGRATNVGARIIVDVGVLCAEIADNAEQETRARIGTTTAEEIGADELERAHIEAYASVATPSLERQPRLLRNAAQLSTALKEAATKAAVVGVTTKKRLPVHLIRQLEKVHKALDVPMVDLYGALHRVPSEDVAAPTVESDPVEAAFEAVRRELEESPTRPQTTPKKGFSIDRTKLARAKEETEAVSKMLSNVFVDTETLAPPPVTELMQGPASARGLFNGLDARHGELLSAILDAGSLKKTEIEARAKAAKLFVDAALDHINEWAFDRLDEPVLEGGDEVRVVPYLADRVRNMREP